jgi:hypothetical protein
MSTDNPVPVDSGQALEGEPTDVEDRRDLDTLINHLQGNGPKLMADAGIARLQPKRLAAIRHGALSRAEDCLQDAQNLARLLTLLVRTQDPDVHPADLADLAIRIGRLTEEHTRWRQLSEHADLYRNQQLIAGEVSRRWAQWACHWSEWPIAKEGG